MSSESEKGKFIIFEGVGGCGKGTQIKIAENLLKRNGLEVISTREPGGVVSAETIRQLIFSLRGEKLIGAEGQLVLFFGARKLWVEGLVKPNIDCGVNVLGDRCYTSTGAYQGYAEGGNQDQILRIADYVMGEYKPDAVLLLDIHTETSMKRRSDPNGDPFDKQGKEYFEKIVAGYREMAKSGWGNLNWFVIDGEPEVEAVSESVAKVLEDIFQKKLNR
jgi:dTMP kinase